MPVDLFWHIAPGFLPRRESSGSILFEDAAGSRFALLTDDRSGWTVRLEDGWWSPVYGKKEPAPVVHFQRQSVLPAECYSLLLLPRNATEALGRFISTKNDSSTPSISGCTYENDSQTHEMIFSESTQNWRAGRIESDARFLYCLFDGEKANSAFRTLRRKLHETGRATDFFRRACCRFSRMACTGRSTKSASAGSPCRPRRYTWITETHQPKRID